MGKIKVVRNEGGSRIIAVTDIIPKEWKVVEASVEKTSDDFVVIKLDKVK